MAAIILRSRLSLSRIKKPFPRSFSSVNQAADATAAAAGPELEAAAAAPGPDRKGFGFLKYGIISALTGATVFAGYATYGSFSLLLLSFPELILSLVLIPLKHCL